MIPVISLWVWRAVETSHYTECHYVKGDAALNEETNWKTKGKSAKRRNKASVLPQANFANQILTESDKK